MGAGSGGATGQTSLVEYQSDAHSMLLKGRSSAATIVAGKDWDGNEETGVYGDADTYADNPSVLRFVKEQGITDAGGNPFEGVSTYEPDTELDATDTDFDELLVDVKALDPQSDWGTFLTTALGRSDEVVGELDIETLAGEVVDRAIAKATEVVTQSNTDASELTSALVTAIRGRASSEADSQTALSFEEAKAALTSLVSDAMGIGTSAASGVISDVLEERSGDSAALNTFDVATPKVQSATDSVAESAETTAASLIASVDVDTIPDAILASAKTDADELEVETETTMTSMANTSTLSGDVQANDAVNTRILDYVDSAKDKVAELEPLARAAGMASMEAVIADIAPNVGDIIANAPDIAAALEPAARDAAKTSMASVMDAVDPDVSSVITGASNIAEVLEPAARDAAKTSMGSVMDIIDPDVSSVIYNAVSELRGSVGDLIREAASAAFSIADPEQVVAAVSSYKKRLLITHMRSVNRFSGGMADIGAVNSSAFVIGMALQESDFETNVADFQAKLELQLYHDIMTTGMTQYAGLLQTMFTQYLDSYERRFAQNLDVYKTNMPAYLQTYLAGLAQHADSYERRFAQNLDVYKVSMPEYMRTFIAGLAQYADSYERRFAQNLDVYKLNAPMYLQTFMSVLPEFVKAYLTSFTQYVSSAEQFAQISGQTKATTIQGLSDVRARLASELLRLSTNASTSLISTQLQSILGLTSAETQSLLKLVGEHAELVKGGTGQYAAAVSDYTGRRLDTYKANAESEANTFEKLFVPEVQTAIRLSGSELSETVRTRLTEKQGKFQVAMSGIGGMSKMLDDKVRFRHGATTLLEQINRARIIAVSEEYGKNLLYDVNSSNWDMELYQKASNVLAGVAGAVVASAGKPNDAQTVLGSMAAGASIGAAAPPIGPIPGIVVGAGVGLVAGGLSAIFD